MLSNVKCALRFFLMRNASDFSPQGSTLVTAPPERGDLRFDLFRQRLDLLLRDVLARQEDVLVESHSVPFLLHEPRPTRSPSSPGKARTGSFEGGNTGGRHLEGAAVAHRNERAALRSAPGGTQRGAPHIEALGSRQGKSDVTLDPLRTTERSGTNDAAPRWVAAQIATNLTSTTQA